MNQSIGSVCEETTANGFEPIQHSENDPFRLLGSIVANDYNRHQSIRSTQPNRHAKQQVTTILDSHPVERCKFPQPQADSAEAQRVAGLCGVQNTLVRQNDDEHAIQCAEEKLIHENHQTTPHQMNTSQAYGLQCIPHGPSPVRGGFGFDAHGQALNEFEYFTVSSMQPAKQDSCRSTGNSQRGYLGRTDNDVNLSEFCSSRYLYYSECRAQAESAVRRSKHILF